MGKRINIVLPETTIQSIDRITRPGERSQFIDRAVRHFVANQSAEALRARLEQTAVRDRDLDQEILSDWLAVDQQEWHQLDTPARKPATRGAVKSTSRRSTRR